MKKLNLFQIVFIFLLSVLGLNTLYSQTMNMKDKYYIGAFGQEQFLYFYKGNMLKWNNLNEMNFNTHFQNCKLWWIQDPDPDYHIKMVGGFYDATSSYMTNVGEMFNRSLLNGQKACLVRYKNMLAAYGQRSTYQVEDNALMITKRPGYGYRYSTVGTDIDDPQYAGVRCKFCDKNVDAPQNYICYGLYENCEQVNCPEDDILFSDIKPTIPGDPYRWYIKPRMRIVNWSGLDINTPVVRIDIIAYNGSTIKSVNMIIGDFLSNINNYQEYYTFYYPQNEYPLSVTGSQLYQGYTFDKYHPENVYNSQVDFKVYWYGNVDVYLDFVRVDDEWAHFLFEPQLDVTLKYDFENKITEEVNEFKNWGGFGQFYGDEYQYNNIDCIVKVKNIIETASDGKLTYCMSSKPFGHLQAKIKR